MMIDYRCMKMSISRNLPGKAAVVHTGGEKTERKKCVFRNSIFRHMLKCYFQKHRGKF